LTGESFTNTLKLLFIKYFYKIDRSSKKIRNC